MTLYDFIDTPHEHTRTPIQPISHFDGSCAARVHHKGNISIAGQRTTLGSLQKGI